MKKIIFFNESVSGTPVGISGLQQSDFSFVLESNHSTVIDFDHFDELGDGYYEFGDFDIPNVSLDVGSGQWSSAVRKLLVRINGIIQTNCEEIDAYNDSCSGVASQDLFVRVDKLGDIVHYWLTYDTSLSGINGFNPFNPPQDSFFRYRMPAIGWIVDKFATTGSLTSLGLSGVVTLANEQNISGKKNFFGGTSFELGTNQVGTNSRFRITTASNPVNGGIVALDVGYRDNNKPLFYFYNSDLLTNSGLSATMVSGTTGSFGVASIYKSGNNVPIFRARGDVEFTGLPKDALSICAGQTNTIVHFHNSDVYGMNYLGSTLTFGNTLLNGQNVSASLYSLTVTGATVTNLNATEANIATMHFESGQISAGITTYFDLDPVTDALSIGGQATFSNPPTMPGFIIDNSGDDYAGEATLSIGGTVTINTSAVQSDSIIICTYSQSGATTPLYTDNINAGTSFDVNGDAGLKFKWLLHNIV